MSVQSCKWLQLQDAGLLHFAEGVPSLGKLGLSKTLVLYGIPHTPRGDPTADMVQNQVMGPGWGVDRLVGPLQSAASPDL